MNNTVTGLPVVVQKTYEFSLWVMQKVESFRRSFRFTLGDRLVLTVLDILTRLVDAYSRRLGQVELSATL